MVAKVAAESVPPVQPAVTAAAEDKGLGASASSSTNGGLTTTTTVATNASEGGSSSSSTGGINGIAVAEAPASTAKGGLKTADIFSGDAVFAWGEGPDAKDAAGGDDVPAAPSGTLDGAQDLSDEQEWSVWNRESQAVSPTPPTVPGWTRDVGAVSTDGATGMEIDSPPASQALPSVRRSGDSSEDSRLETLRERKRNACFVVVGAVDGVAEEVTDVPEDAETWETRRVVVEVKNRMNKARNPPPLYDQIQLVVRRERRSRK